MCLESPQEKWLQGDSGIDEKEVCHSPLSPLPSPLVILVFRSFHIQRGYNQVSVCCSVYL